MDIVTLDFETYWAADYSLSRMSPLEYVRGSRFALISCAVKVNDYPTDVLFGEAEIRKCLKALNWRNSAALGHNMSGFDAYVMAYHLGINPKMWLCTLAMARPLHAKTTGLGLGKLVEHYRAELAAMGVPGLKDGAVLMQTRGRYLEDFTPAERGMMETYNRNDTEQCYGLFKILRKHHKASELWHLDATIRMRTEPQFELDRGLLETAASVERSRKHAALLDLGRALSINGVDWADEDAVVEAARTELASAQKFAALLESLGVEVPMKPSPTNPEKEVPALAKTDEAFTALQEHDNEVVAAAARARLDVKSTLLETRIDKFLTAGAMAGGKLPVPLRLYGADTTGRDSGEEYNPQNLPRINPDKPKVSDALRRSLRAPKGHKVIVADQSGIELRVNHFLWQVASSMALYEASPDKADLYKAFAADLFRKAAEAISKSERQLGKVAQLGLGFGSGAPTFQRIARLMGGMDIPLHSQETVMGATEIVAAWRHIYDEIVQGWKKCGQALLDIMGGREAQIDPWGLLHTTAEGIALPSGRLIRYPDLRMEDDGQWPDGRNRRSAFYAHGRHKARLTGPKVCENVVQALARDSVFDCALEFFKLTGLRPALRVHDELVYVVPEANATELLDTLQGVMRTPPKWWPQLVVWSEGDVANTYGDAK